MAIALAAPMGAAVRDVELLLLPTESPPGRDAWGARR
jgi:hypothetical protein